MEVVYDNMGDKDNIKIAEKHPKFGFSAVLDEVLEEFGGVQEIVSCNWDEDINEGTVVCLMNDWRVIRCIVKSNEFASLSHENRKSKINRECLVFEDMDDWGHWLESGGDAEEDGKKNLKRKVELEKISEYQEKYSDALEDFFSGDFGAIQKIISQAKNG